MRKTRTFLAVLALLAGASACAGDVTAPQRTTTRRFDTGYLGSGNITDPPPPPVNYDTGEVPQDTTGRGGGFIGSGG